MADAFSRRAALLATAALLGGCETFDSIFGERKVRLSGERRPVLDLPDRSLSVDEGAAALPVSLPPPAPRADWPQAGGDAAHAGGHPALGPTLAEAWRADFGSGSSYRRRLTAPPVAAGGTVYAADAFGVVSAFDLARGGRRWRLDTTRRGEDDDGSGAVGGGIAVEGDTVYIASGLAELLAVNAADGNVKWRVRVPAPSRGAPTVAAGKIFLPTIENQLVAFAAEDGKRAWTHRAAAVTAVPLGLPAPAVEGDVVVAGFGSGEIFALRVADGRVQWSESVAPSGAGGMSDVAGMRAMPVISQGRVVAIGMSGLTICVDLRSGRRLWERELSGTEAPWAAGDWIFAVTGGGDAVAIGRDSGQLRWVSSLRPERRGSRPPEPVQLASPVLAGGRLLVATSRGELVALDPASGSVNGRQRLPGPATLQPGVAGDTLFLATEEATLVAMRGGG